MSYVSTVDFIALLRRTSGGVRTVRMPGLDYFVAALARSGLFNTYVSQVAPTANQVTTAWFKPASSGSWASEGVLYLWNVLTTQYEVATPALWSALLFANAQASQIQEVTAPGPVLISVAASIVRVSPPVGAPTTLVAPPSSTKIGGVLISDWRGDAGTNNITVNLTGTDRFPGGLDHWTIASDTGSIFIRPVPGGYVL